MATASEDETARIWALESGACVGVLKGHVDEVLRVAFAPSVVEEICGAPLLATAGADGTVRLWRGGSGCWDLRAPGAGWGPGKEATVVHTLPAGDLGVICAKMF